MLAFGRVCDGVGRGGVSEGGGRSATTRPEIWGRVVAATVLVDAHVAGVLPWTEETVVAAALSVGTGVAGVLPSAAVAVVAPGVGVGAAGVGGAAGSLAGAIRGAG